MTRQLLWSPNTVSCLVKCYRILTRVAIVNRTAFPTGAQRVWECSARIFRVCHLRLDSCSFGLLGLEHRCAHERLRCVGPARWCMPRLCASGDYALPGVVYPGALCLWLCGRAHTARLSRLFEAYLGSRWYLFDATRMTPRNGLVRISTGRDAADASFATIIGAAMLQQMTVSAEALTDEIEEKPGATRPFQPCRGCS